MNIIPNTWLVSNSSLYFADRLLEGEFPVNAYNIFDLSKVTESLLLSDKIVTLPGRGTRIELYDQLKQDKLIEELDVNDGTIDNLVGEVRGDDEIHTCLDKNTLAKIFCDIFPIKEKTIEHYPDELQYRWYEHKKIILDGITWSASWANRKWDSTSKYMDAWFQKDYHQEDNQFEIIKSHQNSASLFFNKYGTFDSLMLHFQDLISDTYLRTLLYLKIAAEYQLNYFPDSIRVPLVEYIDNTLSFEFKKFAQQLVIKFGKDKDKGSYQSEIERITFERSEIKLPPLFALVIRSMAESNRSRNHFLKTILELRETKKIKKFREVLQIQDRALRFESAEDKNELPKIINAIKGLEDREKNIDSVTVKVVNLLDKIAPIVSGLAGVAGLHNETMGIASSSAAFALGFSTKLFRYFKERRLQLLKDLNKEVNQISLYNDKLESVLGSKLTESEIDLLSKLHARQEGYMRPKKY